MKIVWCWERCSAYKIDRTERRHREMLWWCLGRSDLDGHERMGPRSCQRLDQSGVSIVLWDHSGAKAHSVLNAQKGHSDFQAFGRHSEDWEDEILRYWDVWKASDCVPMGERHQLKNLQGWMACFSFGRKRSIPSTHVRFESIAW